MNKNTSKEHIMKALAGLLPEEAQKEVVAAVETFIEGVRSELDQEYDSKLKEAYKIVEEDKATVKKTAEQGYAEAYQIICDLRDRLEVQREEIEHAVEEQYEKAYQIIMQERSKNETLEMDLYEQYDAKAKEIKEFYANQLDAFLKQKGKEFYETAKRDALNDSSLAEHRLAFERILEVAADFMSEEDYHFATKSKLDDLNRKLEDLNGQQKILEAKNFRLATENTRLNEAVRHNAEMLTEATRHEQKERQKKARTVEGRGNRVVEQERVKVIAEHTANETVTSDDDDDASQLIEHVGGEAITDQWAKLAGVPNK